MVRRVIMKMSEFENLKKIAQRMKADFDDPDNADFKRMFRMGYRYPTVEEMESHKVRENIKEYLPYLVYYLPETGVYKPDPSDKEFARTRKYIMDLFLDEVTLVDDEEEVGTVI